MGIDPPMSMGFEVMEFAFTVSGVRKVAAERQKLAKILGYEKIYFWSLCNLFVLPNGKPLAADYRFIPMPQKTQEKVMNKKLSAAQVMKLLAEMEFNERIKNIDMGDYSPLKAENGQNPFALAHLNPGQRVGCVLQTAAGEIRGSIEWKANEKVRKLNLFERQEQLDAEMSLAAARREHRDESTRSSSDIPERSRLAEEGNFSFRLEDTHEALDVRFSVPGSTDQPIAIVHASGAVEVPEKACDDAITNPNASVACRHRKRKRSSHRQATQADETPSTESDQQANQEKSKADSLLLGFFDDIENRDEFGDFYARYQPLILRYCQKRCGVLGLPITDAEDVCHDSMIRIALRFCDGRLSFELQEADWRLINTIIGNKAIDFRRRAKSALSLDQPLSNADEEGSSLGSSIADQTLASQSSVALRIEMIDEVNSAIQQLDEKQQIAIRLQYQDEMSIFEISKVMGQNENTIKSYLHRGKKKLTEILNRTAIASRV